MRKAVIVAEYCAQWPREFDAIDAALRKHPLLSKVQIEHVGSTAVEGLAAKPVIDIDVVASDPSHLAELIAALRDLGYRHRGDLGISGREAFESTLQPELAAHNLYVCIQGGTALRNHLLLRKMLREDQGLCSEYSELKKALARKHAFDIDQYCEAKSAFILRVLELSGMSPAELKQIQAENRL